MIKIVMLTNGEQIIGDVEEHGSEYKITNPFYMIDAVNDHGSSGSRMANLLTFSSIDYITVNTRFVMYEFPVLDSMAEYYSRLTKHIDKSMADSIIQQSLVDLREQEERYEKLLSMVRPKKSKLN